MCSGGCSAVGDVLDRAAEALAVGEVRGVLVERQRVADRRGTCGSGPCRAGGRTGPSAAIARQSCLEPSGAGASARSLWTTAATRRVAGLGWASVRSTQARRRSHRRPGNPRFPAIDGLRAVAVCAVVVTHTAFLSGFNGHGFLGRDHRAPGLRRRAVLHHLGLPALPPVRRRALPRRARRRASGASPAGACCGSCPAYWLALTVLAIWPGLPYVFTRPLVGLLRVPAEPAPAVDQRRDHGGVVAVRRGPVLHLAAALRAAALARCCAGAASGRRCGPRPALLLVLAVASEVTRGLTFADKSPDSVSSTIAGTFSWFALGMILALVSARWHQAPVAERPALAAPGRAQAAGCRGPSPRR